MIHLNNAELLSMPRQVVYMNTTVIWGMTPGI